MNTHYWNTLTWNKLMGKSMVGKNILIAYYDELLDRFLYKTVKVICPDYVENEHVLIVEDPEIDDISIITREFKGHRWEAYEVLEDFLNYADDQ